jgi:hypothetical protein
MGSMSGSLGCGRNHKAYPLPLPIFASEGNSTPLTHTLENFWLPTPHILPWLSNAMPQDPSVQTAIVETMIYEPAPYRNS